MLGDALRAGRSLVVDTGSVAVPEERAALAAAALTGVWAQRAERIPTLVVLDEAHHICPAEPTDPIQRLATDLAILIAGEGRKYGIFLLLATQRPQKVHPSVVAGCESLVLLRMNSLRDVEELSATFSYVPDGLLRLAPGIRPRRGADRRRARTGAAARAHRRPHHARGRRRRPRHLGATGRYDAPA